MSEKSSCKRNQKSYQLLVSTMNQSDDSLCEKMNISSDAVVINQCDRFGFEVLNRGENIVKIHSFAERGVGLSRNSALMRADADIIQFADDDMIFTGTYRADVLAEFERHPNADAILFSLESLNPERPLLKINKFGRVRRVGALKYGCARLAVRREKLVYNNITFSLLFGGGAVYSSGEDTLILQEMLRAGFKIYKSPIKIADVKQDESSWFKGFTEKYYTDKGALFAAALPRLCRIYSIAVALKSKPSDYSRREILRLYFRGIKNFKKKQ